MVAMEPPSALATANSAAMTPFGLPLPKVAVSFAVRLVSA